MTDMDMILNLAWNCKVFGELLYLCSASTNASRTLLETAVSLYSQCYKHPSYGYTSLFHAIQIAVKHSLIHVLPKIGRERQIVGLRMLDRTLSFSLESDHVNERVIEFLVNTVDGWVNVQQITFELLQEKSLLVLYMLQSLVTHGMPINDQSLTYYVESGDASNAECFDFLFQYLSKYSTTYLCKRAMQKQNFRMAARIANSDEHLDIYHVVGIATINLSTLNKLFCNLTPVLRSIFIVKVFADCRDHRLSFNRAVKIAERLLSPSDNYLDATNVDWCEIVEQNISIFLQNPRLLEKLVARTNQRLVPSISLYRLIRIKKKTSRVIKATAIRYLLTCATDVQTLCKAYSQETNDETIEIIGKELECPRLVERAKSLLRMSLCKVNTLPSNKQNCSSQVEHLPKEEQFSNHTELIKLGSNIIPEFSSCLPNENANLALPPEMSEKLEQTSLINKPVESRYSQFEDEEAKCTQTSYQDSSHDTYSKPPEFVDVLRIPNDTEKKDKTSNNESISLCIETSSSVQDYPGEGKATPPQKKEEKTHISESKDSSYVQASANNKSSNPQLHIIKASLNKLITHLCQEPIELPRSVAIIAEEETSNLIEEQSLEEASDEEEDEEYEEWDDQCDRFSIAYMPEVIKFLSSKHPLVMKAMSIIDRLSKGERSQSLSKNLEHRKYKLYEAKLDKSKRILWHEGTGYSPDHRMYCSVVNILAVVLDHKRIDQAARYAENCIDQGIREGGTIRLKCECRGSVNKRRHTPSYYTDLDGQTGTESIGDIELIPVTMRDNSGAIPKYHISETTLSCMINSTFMAKFTLLPSKEEHQIIDMNVEEGELVSMSYHKKSLVVVGRSGTGKTTCCLMRLLKEFLLYWNYVNSDYGPLIPRDVVSSHTIPTNSPRIAIDSIDVHGVENDDETTNDGKASNFEKTTEDEQNEFIHLHQVFVTKSPHLASQVKQRFYDQITEDTLRRHLALKHRPLPTSLLNVEDFHYPLFLTSRELLILLDEVLNDNRFFKRHKDGTLVDEIHCSDLPFDAVQLDIFNAKDDDEDNESDSDSEDEDVIGDHNVQSGITKTQRFEVTASYFKENIWNEIAKGNAKNIDPILVWQEIKSFIKGSVEALESDEGFLSRKKYEEFGKKMAPNFASKRDEIYDLFEKYQQYCQNNRHDKGLFDECDLIYHLYQRVKLIQHPSELPWVVHNFYIDEVQDFTEAELYLLLTLSSCPNGNFLCGDSAQSIMRGVAFRFGDVRSTFYKLQEAKKVEIPEVQFLTVNYRSHAGILRLSESVIELLNRFFSSSFDDVPVKSEKNIPEDAQKPIIVTYDSVDELPYILAGSQDKKREIDFGAHQAIIVQSDEAKQMLPESLHGAIVLTVFEAKGLEFDDVLLFNVFSNSLIDIKHWELVGAYTHLEMETHNSDKILTKYKACLEQFDEHNYRSLNTELKRIYTAITRAKSNLWICDENINKNHAMYAYWMTKQLVRTVDIGTGNEGDNFVSAGSSTQDQWRKQGDYLTTKHLWNEAIKCYEKAIAPAKMLEVQAYIQVEKHEFLLAAEYFLRADTDDHKRALINKAALCLQEAKDHMNAALLFKRLGKISKAADQYLLAGELEDFIELSERKEKHKNVVKKLLKHGYKLQALKKGAQYESERKVTSKNIQWTQLAHECVKYYTDKGDLTLVREAIEYLKSHVLKIKYLKINGLYKDVIKLHLSLNDATEAFQVIHEQSMYNRGLELAIELGNENKELEFLFCLVYSQLFVTKSKCNEIISKYLSLLSEKSIKYNTVGAEVSLINAKLSNSITDIQVRGNTAEEMEFFMIYFNLQLTTKNHFNATDVLYKCLKAKRLSFAFAKKPEERSQSETDWINQVLRLNHVIKLFNHNYLIPQNQCYWLGETKWQTLEPTGNGPQIYPESEVHEWFREHYERYCKIWYEKSGCVTKSLDAYNLHRKLQQNNLVGKNASNVFQNYLNTLSRVVELNKAFGCFPQSNDILLGLFVPSRAIHNHALERRHVTLLQSNAAIHQMFKESYEMMLKSDGLTQSLTTLFDVWRLSLIATGNTTQLEMALRNVRSSHPTTNSFLHFVHRKQSYEHIFQSWLVACNHISTEGSVLHAFKCVYNSLFKGIAHSSEVKRTISDIDIIYICTVQATSLLSIASSAWRKTFLIPNVYEHFISVFNILNCQSKSQLWLLRACSKEVAKCKIKSDLGRYALAHLLKLLDFLMGFVNVNCNVLKSTLSSVAQDDSSLYCIVLILTICANLYIARPTLDNLRVHRYLVTLKTQLLWVMVNKPVKPPFVETVYQLLDIENSVHQLFKIVQFLLARVKSNKLSALNGASIYYKNQYEIPSITFPKIDITSAQTSTLKSPSSLDETESLETSESSEDDMQSYEQPDEVVFIDKFSILKKNMIENGFCNVCGEDISSRTEAPDVHPDSFERQVSQEQDVYEHHVDSLIHKDNLLDYQKYKEMVSKFEKLQCHVDEEIKHLQQKNLTHIKDTQLTQCEEQLIQLLHAVDLDTDSKLYMYNWIRKSENTSKQAERLNDILQELTKISEYDTHMEDYHQEVDTKEREEQEENTDKDLEKKLRILPTRPLKNVKKKQ